MRKRIIASFCVIWLTGIGTATAWGQNRGWIPKRYKTSRSRPVHHRTWSPPAPAQPIVSLGAPIAHQAQLRPDERPSDSSSPTRMASWSHPAGDRRTDYSPVPQGGLFAPGRVIAATPSYDRPGPVYRGQAPDAVPPPGAGGEIAPPPPPPPTADPLFGNEPFNNGMIDPYDAPPTKGGFGSRVKEFFFNCGPNRKPFESDHFFDGFSSPITSPFFAEDPRSLTEVKPLFLYQSIPNKNPRFKGGDIFFYGLQARIAFTERLSFVLNKLGGINFNPEDETTGIGNSNAFSEVWLGPKITLIRNDRTNTLLAFGTTFQIPVSSRSVMQNTGRLSIAPYLSLGQGFDIFGGRLNFINTAGYAFSVNNQRSEYFYNTFHMDFGILGRIYPTLELNWIHYTKNGTSTPGQGFEGGDLINFGATVEGNDLLTIAPGIRYKFSECVQTGVAVEFPIVGRKDLNDFRVTVDLIWRY